MTDNDSSSVDIPSRFNQVEGVGIDWQHPVQPSFPMALSMKAMVEQIAGGECRASPTFADALEIERLQEAIRRSTQEGRWVRASEVT